MVLPECPAELRFALPFLQRAVEVQGQEPVIAYYCRFHAARQILSRNYSKTAETEAFITKLMDELEAEKEMYRDEPAIHDDSKAAAVILPFAMKIFLAADNQERAGQVSKKTGKLFLVASQFLELLRDLSEIPPEIEEKIKYAKWKAAEIARGDPGQPVTRAPAANEPKTAVDEPKAAADKQRPSIKQDLFAAPTQPAPADTSTQTPPPTHPLPLPPHAPSFSGSFSSSIPSATQSRTMPLQSMSWGAAEKHARYAVSAIQFEDRETALKELELAMLTLQQLQ